MSRVEVNKELHDYFINYSSEVNCNRAFPDARDGLKPSQRAILWAMHDSGFSFNKPHVKCAKVDGIVTGNLHPHGSVYGALARMSQDWVENIPEIDFHGANGSKIGGPECAASRYTECRLAPITEECMFSGIDKDVVDFIPNFSEDLTWPSVLPSIFPRLFVNGSQGIGYTIAQEWEPGNIKEFTSKVKQFIKNGKIDCKDIYPDYPTGGIIVNKKDIHNIYETGKGSIILRGKVKVEDNIITITELPYQVYAEPFIQNIKDLVNNNQLAGIEDICNKSDDSGMIIEIECSDDPNIILNKLYKLTDLQCTFSANQMALVNGIPQLLNLKEYITTYINHNIECIKREYTYDLNKAENRLEIVTGLIKAISIIDDIISLIKKSKTSNDAIKSLSTKFKFTENQSKAIVDMRLGKLANMELNSLLKEEKELKNKIEDCNIILSSQEIQNDILIERLEYITKKYGKDRRTQVEDVNIVEERREVKQKEKSNEQCFIVLDKDNYLKRISLVNYKPSKSFFKTIKVGVRDKFIIISEDGFMYKLQASKLPKANINSMGLNLNTLFNSDKKIVNIFAGNEEFDSLIMVTNLGLIKKINRDTVFNLSKTKGAMIMNVKEDFIKFIEGAQEDSTIKINYGNKEYKVKSSALKEKGRSACGVKIAKVRYIPSGVVENMCII